MSTTSVSYNTFSPTQISGCELWVDAGNRTSYTYSGSTLTSITDNSLTKKTITINSAPSVSPTTFNNRPGFVFSSGNRLSAPINALGRNMTLVAVYRVSVNATSVPLTIGISNSGNETGIGFNNAFAYYNIYDFGVAETGNTSVNTWAVNLLHIGVKSSATPNLLSVVNGTPSGSASSAYSNANTQINLGGGGFAFVGVLAEAIVYSVAISTSQRQQLEGYLAWKWGLQGSLPNSHPYKNSPILGVNYAAVPASPGFSINNPVFVPTQISGCQLWFDAADSQSLVLSGSNVIRWNDKSGNNRNASNVVGNPFISRSSLVRNQGIFFNGISYLTGSFSYTSNTLSWFVVGTMDSDGDAFGRLLSFGDPAQWDFDSTLRLNALARENLTNEVTTYRNAFIGRNMFITYSSPFMYSSVINGTTNTPFLNGTAGTGASTSGNFGFNTFGLSCSAGTNIQRNKGFLFEVVVFSTALSISQRQQVEGYLAWKWGLQGSLPASHPFKNSPILGVNVPPVPVSPPQIRSASWNPTLISGCQLWLDGSDRSTITGAAPISGWRDKSGTNRTVTFSGSVTYNVGSLSVNTTTTPSTYFFANVNLKKSQVTYANVFIVHTWTGSGLAGTNQALWGQDIGGGWNRFQLFGFTANPALAYGLSYTPNSPNVTTVSALNTGNRVIYSANYAYQITNGTSAYVNGTLASSLVTEAVSPSETSTTNTYFGTIDTGYSGTVAFHEIIIYTSNVSQTDRQKVEGYLAWKWGLVGNLPGNHPFKLFPPLP
jgi:hypothetical protein